MRANERTRQGDKRITADYRRVSKQRNTRQSPLEHAPLRHSDAIRQFNPKHEERAPTIPSVIPMLRAGARVQTGHRIEPGLRPREFVERMV